MATRLPLLPLALLLSVTGTARAQQAPVTPQPGMLAPIAPYTVAAEAEPALTRPETIALLRKHIRYVFVVLAGAHSFDNAFGTFPGANGLFAGASGPRATAATPGFIQSFRDTTGHLETVTPFRIGPAENANVTDAPYNAHTGLARKLDVHGGVARMDGFAQAEFDRGAKRGGRAGAAMGRQLARLAMSHVDCDTIPFLWRYAARFTLFDAIFATENAPAAPNVIALLAGQAGESQWVERGGRPQSASRGAHRGLLRPAPLLTNAEPFWGSQYDPTAGSSRQPASPSEAEADTMVAANLGVASLPLALAGNTLATALAADPRGKADLAQLHHDLSWLAGHPAPPVFWGWYQEGYGHEPYDPPGIATHVGYAAHRNGAQYFGYIANTPAFAASLHGLGVFFAMLANGTLPAKGVFFVEGGFTNLTGSRPPIENPDFPAPLTPADRATITRAKQGDDDHPATADRMISEALAARVVNAVAARPEIWRHSLILVVTPASAGDYDHVPPRILALGPDGLPLARGLRVPLILISPFARAHAVAHAEGDVAAVLESIEQIFALPALATLPDERAVLAKGASFRAAVPDDFVQRHLGPRDLHTPAADDLLSGFDPARLAGTAPPLPARYARIDAATVNELPPYGGKGCKAIGVTPTDVTLGIRDAPPPGFNPLPETLPADN